MREDTESFFILVYMKAILVSEERLGVSHILYFPSVVNAVCIKHLFSPYNLFHASTFRFRFFTKRTGVLLALVHRKTQVYSRDTVYLFWPCFSAYEASSVHTGILCGSKYAQYDFLSLGLKTSSAMCFLRG